MKKISIVKRSGRWIVLDRGQSTSHPTWELALQHARHLLQPSLREKHLRDNPDYADDLRFRRAMRRAARMEGDAA